MNLPELLGTGSSAGPAITAKGGPDEPNAEAGDAFKSSVQSLSQDSESSEGDVAQQSREETTGVDAYRDTPDVPADPVEPEGSDTQFSTLQQATKSAPATVVQSFLALQAGAQATGPKTLQPSSDRPADVSSKTPTAGEVSQQDSTLKVAKSAEGVKLTSPSIAATETGNTTSRTSGASSEAPTKSGQTTPVSQASNVLTAQEQPLQSVNPTAQRQQGETAVRQNGAGVRAATDLPQPTNTADPRGSTSKVTGEVAVEPKVEAQPVRDHAVEESTFEKRLHERRSDTSAADAKLSDRAAQAQQITTPATQSVVRAGPAVLDFGQTTSNLQTTVTAGQMLGTREVFAERGTVLNVSPAAAADASSRNTIAQISAAIRNQPQMRTIELSLDPPELGRVEIQMDVAEVGLKATLSAERPGTGDLIRRQAEILLQQLNEAGFSDVDLDFRDFGSGGNAGGENQDDQNAGQSTNFSGTTANVAPEARARVQTISNGMDVRL